MDKLTPQDGETPDVVADNIERLREIFPEVFADGEVDFESLKQTLGEYVDDREERYSFTWHGKSRAHRIAQMPSSGTLLPCKEESVNWDSTQNIFIEGDNLEVLKLLQKSYHRKVKMIYINPPYNKGNEGLYPGDSGEGLASYIEATQGDKRRGVECTLNSSASGQYHTNWLNMMYPRLLMARNLLADDGYLVVSIDDDELKHLTALLDEILGEENRLAVLVLDRNRKNDARYFSVGHEYMVVYAKNKLRLDEAKIRLRMPKDGVEDIRELFENLRAEYDDDWDKVRKGLREFYATIPKDDPRKPLTRFTKVDERGPYRTDGDTSWPGGGGPRYDVPHPVTRRPCKVPTRGWVWPSYERMVQEIEGGSVVFGDDETTVPSRRRNLFEATEQVMRSVAFSYAQKTVQELEQLFDGTSPVANPKDPRDLKRLVEYLCGPNDTVLELFSRSGEMAHAVLEANVESGSSRRFICVHLPEVLDPTHPAGRAALALCQALEVNPTTASVARDRLTRVCVKQGRGEVGYRAFRLAESCFKTWDPSFEEVQAALFDAVENKKADRSDEDVVWEILLKYGLDIGIRVEHRRLHEGTAFVIGGAVLVVYLGQVHSAKTVRDIVAIKNELEPLFMRVVFDDAGFLDDIIKTNASQALAQAGVTDVRSV